MINKHWSYFVIISYYAMTVYYDYMLIMVVIYQVIVIYTFTLILLHLSGSIREHHIG